MLEFRLYFYLTILVVWGDQSIGVDINSLVPSQIFVTKYISYLEL